MRIVVALGGNALLKRGEPMTADVQRKNVKTAAQALAPSPSNINLSFHTATVPKCCPGRHDRLHHRARMGTCCRSSFATLSTMIEVDPIRRIRPCPAHGVGGSPGGYQAIEYVPTSTPTRFA